MSKKLFVGGLSWDTTDDSLRAAFAQFGDVTEAKVILDRESGRSRGFGFVTFDDESAADAAIQGLDGQPIDGRNVRVNEAHERQRGGGGGGGGRGGYRGGGGGGGYGGGGYRGGGGGGYGGGGGGGYGGGGGGGYRDQGGGGGGYGRDGGGGGGGGRDGGRRGGRGRGRGRDDDY